jgi:hypothetical protein
MTSLMRPNPVRAALQAGGTAYGTMAFEFFSPGLMTILAAAGAEFVLLDTEHSGVGIETIKSQIAASRGLGIVPMVRVPGCHYHLIARARCGCDGHHGADGRDGSSGAAECILVPIPPEWGTRGRVRYAA